MGEKLVFLTGHLAEARVKQTIAEAGLDEARAQVINLGIKVAALMSEAIVKNRLKLPCGVTRVVVPGRSRMNLAHLSEHFGVAFEHGPDEVIDLGPFLGAGAKVPDFSKHDVCIFAEIVEAPQLEISQIIERAHTYGVAGADVIDIGCQPDNAFPHLAKTVQALKAEGFKVSVDSGDLDELRLGARAGADYVLSLDESSLDVISGTKAVPVLVPKPHGDLASLLRAIDKACALGIPHLADPILDPIHFGFTSSLLRYAQLRQERPDVEILMGTGNLTELTDADSQGVTATLMGVCSELHIQNVLIVQVSPHTRRTVYEHDAARRLMYRAREDNSLPKMYGGGLLSLHDLRPFAHSLEEIEKMASSVRDANYRIAVSEEGTHIYNRDRHLRSTDPFSLFPKLGVEKDGAHAFYLGYELAKAEIAWQLGKRYAQDGPLKWGVAAQEKAEDLTQHAPEGATKTKAKTKADMKIKAETKTTSLSSPDANSKPDRGDESKG